jgi:hypothetical protein
LDFLNPDIVIVGVDQSDVIQDVKEFDNYILENGYPLVLKDAEKLGLKREQTLWAMNVQGEMVADRVVYGGKARLRMASSLADMGFSLLDGLIKPARPAYSGSKPDIDLFQSYPNVKSATDFSQKYPGVKIVKYPDLVAKYGDDLSTDLPKYVLGNMIPYTLDRALKEYKKSYKSLEFIRNETSKRGQKLYLSSYPYPWMITPYESVPYQLERFKRPYPSTRPQENTVFDFSENRVHPQLIARYASDLGIRHLNAYPAFEKDPYAKWGKFDVHFNASGYAVYARVLFEGIREDLERLKAAAKSRH